MDRYKKTEQFVKTELMKMVDYPDTCEHEAQYRIEHSFRVAHIAAEIAKKEGLDEERLYITGLLHDIGYSVEMKEGEYREHGRIGARIARPFLKELGYSDGEVEEMCYGIAIHVDEKADFPGEKTPFTMTIGEADNIDRFDAFRLYEGLHECDYGNMPIEKQSELVIRRIEGLKRLREEPISTPTGAAMWHEKIDYQIGFYEKLKSQIEHSC